MNTETIKQYVVEQLARNERLLASERTASYYEDEVRLRALWLQAEQAEQLARIAANLDKLYISADENPDVQDIAKKLARIGTIIENATSEGGH
jgi:predicted ATPase